MLVKRRDHDSVQNFPNLTESGNFYDRRFELFNVKAEQLVKIPEYGFQRCKYLRSCVTGLKSIPIGCFYQCSVLQSINLSKVAEIKSSAFNYCVSLKLISSSTVNYVESNAFGNCKCLQRVWLPNCKVIQIKAFFQCLNIQYFHAPKFVYDRNLNSSDLCKFLIGTHDLQNLETSLSFQSIVNFKYSVQKIIKDEFPFDYRHTAPHTLCKLSDLNFQIYQPTFGDFKHANTLICPLMPKLKLTLVQQQYSQCLKFLICNRLQHVSENAFMNFSALQSVHTRLKSLRRCAFYNCYSLRTINLSKCLKIPDLCFFNCFNLGPQLLGAKRICSQAFQNCYSLKFVRAPRLGSCEVDAFSNAQILLESKFKGQIADVEMGVVDDGELRYIGEFEGMLKMNQWLMKKIKSGARVVQKETVKVKKMMEIVRLK